MNNMPRWLLVGVIMPVICLLLLSSGAEATEWYVNITTGDTANDGLGVGTAKKYLGNIFASRNSSVSLLNAGDTVNIAAGTYNDTIIIDTNYIWVLGADSTTTILNYGDSSSATRARGIFADTQTGLVIRNLQVTNCLDGIWWSNVNNSQLDRVWVTHNGDDGIYWRDVDNSRIEGVSATRNGYIGVDFYFCDTNVISAYAYANGTYGFEIWESNGNRFENNTSDSNGGYGFEVGDVDSNTFSGYTVSNSYVEGFVMYGGSDNNLITNMLFRNNGYLGLQMFGPSSSNNLIVGNTFRQNVAGGIEIYCDGNTVMRNLIQNNFGAGLSLSQANNNFIAQNTFDSNSEYAISLNLSTADTFVKNIFMTGPGKPDSGVVNYSDTVFEFYRNYWGTTDSSVIAGRIRGVGANAVRWQPFRLGTVDTAANADTIAPAAPANVGAWARGGACTLTWSASTTNEEPSALGANVAGYNVYRSRMSDTSWWAPVGSTVATTYCDSGLAADTFYYYRVTAYDNHAPWPNESWYSAVATVIDAPGPNAWYVNDTGTAGDSFCSATGSAAQSGFTRATPKRRISDILLTASAGDSIYIDAGTYYETCVITANGVSLIGADSRVTIIDGSYNDIAWSIGVYAANLLGLRVENLQFIWSDNGVVFDTVGSSVIRGDSFNNQALDALMLNGADSNAVENCRFSNNSGWSFNLDDAKQNTLRNNLISTTSGYLSPGADSCQISGNVLAGAGLNNDADSTSISGNSMTGNVKIDIASGTACVITGNTFSGGGGILVQGGIGHIVTQNTVSGHVGPNRAFEFYGGTETCSITGNLASGGNMIAFEIGGTGHTVSNNVARDNIGGNADGFYVTGTANLLTQNDALRNGRYGFRLSAAASGNILKNNRSDSNVEQGILVQGAGNTLAHNRVAENRKDGIMLFSGLQNTLLQNTMDSNAWYGLTISSSAAGCTVGKNNILTSPLRPDSGVWYDSTVALDLTRTWWGTTDSVAMRAKLNGSGRNFINYQPARLGTIDTVANADTIAPAAPVSVTLSGTGTLACTIAWSASAANEEIGGAPGDLAGYRVYRSTTSGTSYWAPIGTTAAGDTDYVDTAVGYTAYYYRVTAYDNHSPWPNESWYSDSLALADLTPPDTSGPNTWYVNIATGDTSYLGLTAAAPKKYLGQVFASRNRPVSMLTQGDTVMIAVGTYSDTVSIDTDYVWMIGADSATTVISGGDIGIDVESCTGVVLQHLGLTGHSGFGIYLLNVTAGRIEDCRASNSGADGMMLENCLSCTVTGNTLTGNLMHGMIIYGGSQEVYIGNNLAAGNAMTGFYNTSSISRLTYAGNVSTGNGESGFYVDGSIISFIGNSSSNNRDTGVVLVNATDVFLRQNQVDSNGRGGFDFGFSAADTVNKNNFSRGGYPGDFAAAAMSSGAILDFRRNYWGTTDSAAISALMQGSGADRIRWAPYRLGKADTAANADTIAPTAPDSATVIDSSYRTTSCTIVWTASGSNEEIGGGAPGDLAGYRVYRSRTSDTSYWAPVGTTADTSYVATGLVAGETYYFRVTAYDNHSPWPNESWYSDTIVRVIVAPGQGDFINTGTSANVVDATDLAYLNAQAALYWGAAPADLRCDLDGDGILDFDDIAMFAVLFGS